MLTGRAAVAKGTRGLRIARSSLALVLLLIAAAAVYGFVTFA